MRGQNNGLKPSAQAPPGVVSSPWVASVPTEKDRTTLATYVIEPPDILLIDAVKLVPKAPYHIEALDVVQISVTGTLLDQPISGQYPIDPGGLVDLGPAYGKVNILGQTTDEAQKSIEKHLRPRSSRPRFRSAWARPPASSRSPASTWSGPTARSTWGRTARCTSPA